MRILLCQCKSARLIEPTIYEAALKSLEGRFQIHCVDDLCAMAAAKDERLVRWAREPLTVLACFERAVRSLFVYAGQTLPEPARIVNLRTAASADEVLLGLTDESSGQITETVSAIAENWPAWFPVIDYTRCRNCKQCLNFCLFGVYAQTEDKKVRVERPQSCKNGCPACARVCPDAAIIFPKYQKSPINGDRVDEAIWRQSHAESAKSLRQRLSGNVYQLLRRRNEEPLPASLQDLALLKEQLDIPDVLLKPQDDLFKFKRDS